MDNDMYINFLKLKKILKDFEDNKDVFKLLICLIIVGEGVVKYTLVDSPSYTQDPINFHKFLLCFEKINCLYNNGIFLIKNNNIDSRYLISTSDTISTSQLEELSELSADDFMKRYKKYENTYEFNDHTRSCISVYYYISINFEKVYFKNEHFVGKNMSIIILDVFSNLKKFNSLVNSLDYEVFYDIKTLPSYSEMYQILLNKNKITILENRDRLSKDFELEFYMNNWTESKTYRHLNSLDDLGKLSKIYKITVIDKKILDIPISNKNLDEYIIDFDKKFWENKKKIKWKKLCTFL